MEDIHAPIPRVLGEVGLEVSHERSRRQAVRHPSVREDDRHLHFAPALVDEFVERGRHR